MFAMREHDALRLAGRARRELDERRVVRLRRVRARPALEMSSSLSSRNVRCSSASTMRLLAGLTRAKAPRRSSELAVGVEQRRAELPRDAQQLVLVLVADADRDGHRHDAAVAGTPSTRR